LFKKGFAMVFHLWMSHILIILVPFISPLLCIPYPLLFKMASLYHLPTQMQCISVLFTLRHSLFLSLLPLDPSNSPTIANMFSIRMYDHVCIYVSIYSLVFHIWEKICNLCFSEPDLCHLAWWFPVLSIYLQTT
jgi:hypothetical protein